MEQVRALNTLEPFIALSKSANSSRAAADLITQATSAPNTYVFAELLQTPNIQALRESSEYSPYLTLLEVFAWGTYADYTSNPTLPELSPQQQQKLRLLSLLTLSSSGPSSLTYPSLQTALSLLSPRDLEDLVTTAIYANLVTGSLDPHNQQVAITSVAPLRDLSPGSIPALQASLGAWRQRCEGVLSDLETEIQRIKNRTREKEERRRKTQRAIDEAVKFGGGDGEEGKGWKRGAEENNGVGVRMEDVMEVDEQGGRAGLRSAKRGIGRRLGP